MNKFINAFVTKIKIQSLDSSGMTMFTDKPNVLFVLPKESRQPCSNSSGEVVKNQCLRPEKTKPRM